MTFVPPGSRQLPSSLNPRQPELSGSVFGLFVELVRRRTGFVIAEAHRSRLESRLLVDAKAAGSYYELYTQLREEPLEGGAFGRLLDAAVNGETYFFRDMESLLAMSEEIVPERLLAVGQEGTVDIWSAGCSTGEEPYTIAMLLERKGMLRGRRVRIRATDLSPGSIRRARAGIFGPHAVRATSPERLALHFDPAPGGRFQIKPALESAVTFEARSILSEPVPGPPCDVVVCRNVLIYLDPESRSRAVEIFAARLKPGGYLLLGPSDALAAAATPLTLVRLAHDVAYRK